MRLFVEKPLASPGSVNYDILYKNFEHLGAVRVMDEQDEVCKLWSRGEQVE